MARHSKNAKLNKRIRSNTHPPREEVMSELPPEEYDHDGDRDTAEVDSWSRSTGDGFCQECGNGVKSGVKFCERCGPDDEESEVDLTDEDRYLDKRLSDREDFHSDEAIGPVDSEPYYPEY